MPDVFETWWENNPDAQALRAMYANQPFAIVAMKNVAGLAWNQAIDLAKVIVEREGKV
jgi:hypothetical protein